ncbi:MAG: alpha-galactosidase [Gorillibacterium sp.]|nr:alpha-galactosidase [Gorillibacterium sp.]
MIKDSGATVKLDEGSKSHIRADNGLVKLEIDLETGEISYIGLKGFYVKGIRSAYRWKGREVNTCLYENHRMKEQPTTVEDGFGKGVHLTVIHESSGIPTLEQHYYLYENMPFVLSRSVVVSNEEIKLNFFAVIQSKSLSLGATETLLEDELRVLRVPYDNDKWVRYTVESPPVATESYEVTTLFQPISRRGIIIGSLSHDVWKTGIKVKGEQAGAIDELELYGGAASEMTRDSQPHGYVLGSRIESPLVFLGFYEDYRQGLEAYGRANATIAPPLKWEGGVPFGWNSWSAAADKLDYELYTATSDFLKHEVQDYGFQNEGTLYINFDSFWTNLTKEQMQDALKRIHQNGHKAGTYWTPFAFWGKPQEFDRKVEGTDGEYTYGDILLRDYEGEPLPDIAGGLAIDPTHPGTLKRIDWFTDKFVTDGFEYIKLDFMAHGALEGKHDNPSITTGIAAYHYGMSYLAEKLSPERIGRPFFINLSIAPLFPHAFAHSRRVSCDVFGTIQDTEYLLNSLTHGWWINDTMYRFNDPDHSVLYKSFNQPATTRHEGRSRLSASIIAGTVLLLGDDYREEEAAWRAKTWLQNQEIINLARLGKTFMPVDGNWGKAASDTFILSDPNQAGSVYVAVFNFDPAAIAHKSIDLERIGLDASCRYNAKDLWEGTEVEVVGKLSVELQPAEAKIYRFCRIKS